MSMDGSSRHIPLITGVGLGVEAGRVVSVGIGVFVIDTRVFVAIVVEVGNTAFRLLQELWKTKSTVTIRIPGDHLK
jgi:hypothetical protein